METSQAKGHARPAVRPQLPPDFQPEDVDELLASGSRSASPDTGVVPIDRSRRRWTVRVHWGIVFAVVASLILWLAIKAVVDLAF